MYFKPNYAVVRHALSKCGLGILIIALSSFSIAAAAVVLDEAINSLREEQGGDTLATIQLLLPAAETNAELQRSKRSYNYCDAVIEILGQASSEDISGHVIDAFGSREESMYS